MRTIVYNIYMSKYEIYSTEVFDTWIDSLKNNTTRSMLLTYIDRMADGNLGNVKSVGDGVIERKINVGPGYRIYFTKTGSTILLLLCGGDKSTQERDIKLAKQLKLGV